MTAQYRILMILAAIILAIFISESQVFPRSADGSEFTYRPEDTSAPQVTATPEPEPTEEPTPAPTFDPDNMPTEQQIFLKKFDGIDLSRVLFIGDSVTQGIDIYQPLPGVKVISEKGLSSYLLMEKMPQIEAYEPKTIFVLVGLNDMYGTIENEQYFANYKEFILAIKEKLPETRVVIQAIFPVARGVEETNPNVNNAIINAFNVRLLKLANDLNVMFADVRSIFQDAQGYMREDISPDGIHFYSETYLLWMEKLLPYMR